MPASLTDAPGPRPALSAVPGRAPDITRLAARARRTHGLARRTADRHAAAAVVAEEIRRLGRHWRPDGPSTDGGTRRAGENRRTKGAL